MRGIGPDVQALLSPLSSTVTGAGDVYFAQARAGVLRLVVPSWGGPRSMQSLPHHVWRVHLENKDDGGRCAARIDVRKCAGEWRWEFSRPR